MTEDQVTKIAERIERIYVRVRQLERESADPHGGLRLIPGEEWLNTPLRSRLAAVDDALSGLRYAAWCIGETLIVMGGTAALDAVLRRVERGEHGFKIASWLDHRWDGVTDGRQGWHA
ncbi:hypothetical protein HRJ34_21205 [Rhizorhabdus wittichii]|uniref:Uncharacterized protein n=1 Tax=Rhizorhabdus wittichii TaxID=160791 RepID=A0A975D336_9SPHN|nr:hypothetical protein [Rhizorhabdus wittichii]QTH20815.1 hypothetical protein HRJ34_21205 [Rhizorhabdus wittichii]